MENRLEIVTHVQRLTGRSDTNYVATIRDFLNESVREWARHRPWLGLKRRITAFTTGERYLILPHWVERPLQIFDKTNAGPVEQGGNFDYQFPNSLSANQSGRAIMWQDMGTVPTVTDPSGQITVESSDAGDTNDLRIVGFCTCTAASGTPLAQEVVHETMTLNGTSTVTSTNSFSEIISIGKNADTDGNVSIRDATSSTLLARINQYEHNSKYLRLELIHVPNANTELEITVLVRPQELDDDSQSPHPSISTDFLAWNTAGLSLISIGERQAGTLFLQKAKAILDQEDYRVKNFGDQFLQLQPIVDLTRAEEAQIEGP